MAALSKMVHDHRQKVRVFLVEDESIVRRGIELLLCREPAFEVCGHAGRQEDALKQILTLNPDLVVVDLVLKEGNGFELMRELRAFGAKAKFVVFSMHSMVSDVRNALRAGANGYVAKEEGSEHLLEAMREVMLGGCFLTEAISRELAKHKRDAPPRTFRSRHR